MVAETTSDSWLTNILGPPRKGSVLEPKRSKIGVLAFEVATMMSKVINLWQLVSDAQIARLREYITNSPGIKRLVSEDDKYLMDLALAEIIENLECLAKSVVRLGRRCADPVYQNLDQIFDASFEMDLSWSVWQYRLKKMERKVKKMERFVAATNQLYQEIEVLGEHEQTLRRLKSGSNPSQLQLLEFQPRVMLQRQEIKNLQEMSPWVRTYDYIVRLLFRSIFTIIMRIKFALGINLIGNGEGSNQFEDFHNNSFAHNRSVPVMLQSSVYPSENNMPRVYSGPLGKSFSNLGLDGDKNQSNNRELLTCQSSVRRGKPSQMRSRPLASIGSLGVCMKAGSYSPAINGYAPSNSGISRSNRSSQGVAGAFDEMNALASSCKGAKTTLFNFKRKLLVAPPSTLGFTALALHYANIIILIEKLASSPQLISLDARDNLYNMLPASVKTTLRALLRPFSKKSASSIYDPALAADWGLALPRILEWLSPLAQNTVRWHSERNVEKHQMTSRAHSQMTSRTNVLLVQTLYFGSKAKTEATIIELLLGLNYLSQYVQS
nr:Ferredoxin-dependent glutamate synthase [Ipomoea batatas]GMD41525.1 Ferredoxin-dependent glutamate synthase [Ipomoea batatas]